MYILFQGIQWVSNGPRYSKVFKFYLLVQGIKRVLKGYLVVKGIKSVSINQGYSKGI